MADSQIIELDDHRTAGWIVTKGACRGCGSTCVSVMPLECPRDNTECNKCGAWLWCVTHYQCGDEMVSRLELVDG